MNFRIFFLSLFSFLFLTFSTASAQQSPDEFVISLMKEATALSNLSEDTREQALLNLVRRSFDIPMVGKFGFRKILAKSYIQTETRIFRSV